MATRLVWENRPSRRVNTYLFDTNIFLEILLGQAKAKACMNILAQVNEEQEGWVTAFSLHAIEAIVGKNHQGIPLLTQFLGSILANPFLHVYYTSLKEELAIVKQMAKFTLDFDDALQYYVAHKNQWKLVSLDRDFRKIKGVEIVFP